MSNTRLVLLTMYILTVCGLWIAMLGWYVIPVWFVAGTVVGVWTTIDDRILFSTWYARVGQSLTLFLVTAFVDPMAAVVLVVVNVVGSTLMLHWMEPVYD